jgi:small-conductance mechanosensitive channel
MIGLGQTEADDPIDAVIERVGETFGSTPWFGWVALFGFLLGGMIVGKLLSMVLNSWSDHATRREKPAQAALAGAGHTPIIIAFTTLGLTMGLAWINMSDPVATFMARCVSLLYTIAFAWFLYNMVDLFDLLLRRLTARTRSTLDDQLVPLLRRTLRLFLIVLFVMFTAENIFGANITAWLAGLGVAGLAVSLAAQDSIKNVFGSITVMLDQIFSVGDRIVFDGKDGNVEEIGFRSTRVRTLEGELFTVPNAKFVDGSVLNITRRPCIRRVMNVTITYDTPLEKVERAVQIIKGILTEPEIAKVFVPKFPPRVAFDELNADSLNIKVFYWYAPSSDYWGYLDHAQAFNLRLMREFEKEGIEFAFPTQTLYLAGDAKRSLKIGREEREHVATDGEDGHGLEEGGRGVQGESHVR